MELGIFTFEWFIIMGAIAIVIGYRFLKEPIKKWLRK